MYIWEFPKIRGTILGGLHNDNEDCSILESTLGSPFFAELPYCLQVHCCLEQAYVQSSIRVLNPKP